MCKIYKIVTIPSQLNAYTTGRMETWSIEEDCEINDYEQAKEYVINMNRKHSELPNFIVDMNELAKKVFIDKFCFGEEHLDMVRYFLGKPDRKKIAKCLSNKGIRFA